MLRSGAAPNSVAGRIPMANAVKHKFVSRKTKKTKAVKPMFVSRIPMATMQNHCFVSCIPMANDVKPLLLFTYSYALRSKTNVLFHVFL